MVLIDPGEGASARLEVCDQGPGIAVGAVRRGRSDRGSTGLGLDIARACAEASGGRLELDRIGRVDPRAAVAWPSLIGAQLD